MFVLAEKKGKKKGFGGWIKKEKKSISKEKNISILLLQKLNITYKLKEFNDLIKSITLHSEKNEVKMEIVLKELKRVDNFEKLNKKLYIVFIASLISADSLPKMPPARPPRNSPRT